MRETKPTERSRIRSAGALARMLPAACLWLAWALPSTSPAQTNVTHKGPPENRYLLIVETSRSIHGRLDGTLRTIFGLIESGMRGRMHQGDTLGVWTFNDSLYTGQLGLQDWYKDERREVADRVATFLQEQHYEKRGKLDKVVPAMMRMVNASEFITIILVSDGSDEIHGTPFDKQINESFKLWYAQQQDSKLPFVTVLQASHGTLTGFSVAAVPWPVDFPALPTELRIAKKPPGHAPAESPKPATHLAQPLIISGKKHEAAPAATSPQPLLVPAPPASSAGKPIDAPITNIVSTGSVSAVTSVPTNPAPVTPTAALTPPPNTAENASAAPQNLPVNPPKEEKTAAPVSATTSLQQESPPSNPSSSVEPSNPAKLAAEPEAAPASSPVPAPVSAQKLNETVAPAQASNAPVSSRSGYAVLATGLVFVSVLAGILFRLKTKRSRPTNHISLITRSLERNRP